MPQDRPRSGQRKRSRPLHRQSLRQFCLPLSMVGWEQMPWQSLQRIGQLRQLPPSLFRSAIVVIGLALLFMTTSCVHTCEFRDAHGRVIPGSVATMETVTIGGIPQSIWFRGVSQSNPALILLHGGPAPANRRYSAITIPLSNSIS